MPANILNATSVEPQTLAALTLTGDTDDLVYTVGTGQSVIVKTLTMCNTTADPNLAATPASAFVSLWVVPSGTSTIGHIASFFQLLPGDTQGFADYIADLGEGDTLHAFALDLTGQVPMPNTVDLVLTGILNS